MNTIATKELIGPRRSAWKRAGRMGVLLLLTYFAVVGYFWANEDAIIFRPTSAEAYWRPAPDPVISDVWFTLADGTPIHAWWLPIDGSEDAVLICHGNAGNVSHRGERLLEFAEAVGRSTLMLDYPGYGKSGGRPTEAGCYEAGERAYFWLVEELGIPPERVALYGESLGGGVAVELAHRHPAGALILVNTFTSLPAAGRANYPFLPTEWLMTNRFDNLSKIRACDQPLLIGGATADRLIPFANSVELYEAATEPKEFVRFEGAGHADPLPPQFMIRVREFLDEHLGKDDKNRLTPAERSPITAGS